jgi:hypothetical protein
MRVTAHHVIWSVLPGAAVAGVLRQEAHSRRLRPGLRRAGASRAAPPPGDSARQPASPPPEVVEPGTETS